MAIRNTLVSIYLFLLLHESLYQFAKADVYMHNPRGSNNRLNGVRTNRLNDNRVFDSQNNAKGGYNVAETSPEETKNPKKESEWFNMKYYMSGAGEGETILPIEWTNQHGCGHGDLNCNIVLQYKCQPTTITDKHRIMRNGIKTNTPRYKKLSDVFSSYKNKERAAKRYARSVRALNEPWEWYDKCARRERNKGLFTADQNLKNDDTRSTRQNPNGNQSGYECPEERDYYPYWHPTDWIDIAVLANNKQEDCNYYKAQSFNTQEKGECMEKYEEEDRYRHASVYNNAADCEANGGLWVAFHNFLEIKEDTTEEECNELDNTEWEIPYRSDEIDKLTGDDPNAWKKCLVKLPKPDCIQAPTSRPNHLGNGENIAPLTYNWVLPHFPSGQEQRCVLRIRYNISTNDYDVTETFSSSNNDDDVIAEDPDVNIGESSNNKVPLQLAINTAQFGRTFQDRSHIFRIIPRKETFEDCVIHNLNVRGKRGNIVQTFPAVEYDFTHKHLKIEPSHCVHIQFAGSNRNPKGNDGEGRAKTDRSNLVAMSSPDISYPTEETQGTLFDQATVVGAPDEEDEVTQTGADIAIAMATAGHFKTAASVPQNLNLQNCNADQAQTLDCYRPSYHGLLLKFEQPGVYYYMCSRNNNFTNRNQKAAIEVVEE